MADRISNVVTPQFLQGVSLGFKNRAMIADVVAPVIPVPRDRGLYRVYGKNEFLLHEARWGYGTIPNAVDYRWQSGTYFSEPRKLRIKLLDAEVRNADSDLNLRRDYTRVVTNAIALARENRVAQMFANSANYPGPNVVTKAGGSEWNTVVSATPKVPITDLQTAITAVKTSAVVPQDQLTVIIPELVFDESFRYNTFLLTSLNYTSPDSYTPDMLARFLGIKQVLIASVMTAGPGPEVAGADVVTGYTMSWLWLDNVWIGYVDPTQNELAPTFARSFNWRGDTGGQQRQIRQYRFDDEGAEADWIECKENMDEQIVFSGAGFLYKNTSSTI